MVGSGSIACRVAVAGPGLTSNTLRPFHGSCDTFPTSRPIQSRYSIGSIETGVAWEFGFLCEPRAMGIPQANPIPEKRLKCSKGRGVNRSRHRRLKSRGDTPS